MWDYEGLHDCFLRQGCCCVKFVSEWEAGPVNRAEPYNPSRWASLVQYDPNLQAFVGKKKNTNPLFQEEEQVCAIGWL